MYRGRIITLEGLDGSGKSTQTSLLMDYFESIDSPCQFIHFPMLNQGYYGQMIAQFLRGEFGGLDEVHPQLVALLFAEDRNEHKKTLVRWLRDGYTILMDRYVHSNIAFQCAKLKNEEEKQILKDWILEFEYEHNSLPKPVLSLYLDVPLEVVERSLAADREGDDREYLEGKEDIHESSFDFQVEVGKEYQKLLHQDSSFHSVQCFDHEHRWRATAEIHLDIKKLLQERKII